LFQLSGKSDGLLPEPSSTDPHLHVDLFSDELPAPRTNSGVLMSRNLLLTMAFQVMRLGASGDLRGPSYHTALAGFCTPG
jgi:hypothetical protein